MANSKLVRIGKGVAIWVPTIVFAALFILQGLMKLTGMEVCVQRFRHYGYPDPFYLVVGVLELGSRSPAEFSVEVDAIRWPVGSRSVLRTPSAIESYTLSEHGVSLTAVSAENQHRIRVIDGTMER